jgi:hypothetical protein
MTYTFRDAMAEILPHVMPEYFWQKSSDGQLEFAVPAWDVQSVEYDVALSLHKAPLSDKINIRTITRGLSNPDDCEFPIYESAGLIPTVSVRFQKGFES